ncbi:hypothetical protein BGX34_001405 [Mortierella sp. NVP85]|nr:hypothetical protein BGX34_001405 [Mortierella sp. NVP85]
MSYQEESTSHFREHTSSSGSSRSIAQDSATTTTSIEGSSGNAQNHSIKSDHAHQNTIRSSGPRPDERLAKIKIVQQPLHARMCGFGEKDRRPIDPPPIVQLLLDEDHDQHPSKQAQRSATKSSSVSSSSRPKRKNRADDHGHEADDDNHADNEDAGLDDGEDVSTDTHTTGRHGSNPSGSKPSPSLGKRGRPSVSQKSGGVKAKRSGSDDDDSDHSNSESDTEDQDNGHHHAGEGQDPLFVLHVSLWSADGKEVRNMIATPGQSDPPKLTRILMGSLVVSPVLLNNVEGVPGWYFSFPDLSIRTEGVYTLKFSLMRFGSFDFSDSEDGHASTIIAEEVSEPFTVFSAKKFPGMTESTELSKTFAKQGLKIPIRNDLRVRKVDRE